MEEQNKKIVIKDIKGIEKFLNNDYISNELKNKLKKSDIIILPIEKFREFKDPLFPNGTEKIYLFLKDNLSKEYNLEIAIDEQDYKELGLHHNLIFLGIFMCKEILLPFLLSMLANYTYYKLPLRSKEEKVKLTIIVSDRLKKIDFEGPAKDLKNISKEIKDISKNE
ncbi:MAG: hypothetical protein WC549_01465 [Actinomycetota bacterium]